MKPTADRRGSLIQFQKRRQLFIRGHNETLSVAAMRVSSGAPSILLG
jgi:hypothetical protein